MHVLKHFLTISKHRRAVRKLCFKCGLIRQGLAHDRSKYSAAEFWPGAKYYQGYRSPQAREREVLGYSAAWLHHKGRNKHHFEYWTDFADGKRVYVEMPAKYLAEMICDRIAASKIYLKENYDDSKPLEYFENKTDKEGMHPATCEKLRYFLTMLKERGEKQTFKELKKYVKQNKK
ncbi:MAG: catalase [Clostridia bacterium]|nr:catalase [Clostridia bacterium]